MGWAKPYWVISVPIQVQDLLLEAAVAHVPLVSAKLVPVSPPLVGRPQEVAVVPALSAAVPTEGVLLAPSLPLKEVVVALELVVFHLPVLLGLG